MLEKLNDVQTKDLSLDALEVEKSNVPQALLDLQADSEVLQRKLADRREKHQDVAKQVRASELEMAALTDRRKAAAASALEAESNKEASQFQNQELQFATRLEELEADTIPLMERMEVLGGEVAGLEAEANELTPKLETMIAEEKARVEGIMIGMTNLRSEREAIAREVNSSLLKQYEQVRKAKRGTAIANIVNNERCGGCNVKLPIYVLQKVSKAQDIVRCPSCGRILWSK
ncbi:MAG: zinc ribbon domain-containing protein [Trueperaceae bacterium]